MWYNLFYLNTGCPWDNKRIQFSTYDNWKVMINEYENVCGSKVVFVSLPMIFRLVNFHLPWNLRGNIYLGCIFIQFCGKILMDEMKP